MDWIDAGALSEVPVAVRSGPGFVSILHPAAEEATAPEQDTAPAYFGDLNLDQLVASITAGREDYKLEPFFFASLGSLEAIVYRHQVMRDLEAEPTASCLSAFAEATREMRKQLEQMKKLYDVLQKQAWFLDAAGTYCDAVRALEGSLHNLELRSAGLLGFRDFVAAYAASAGFMRLAKTVSDLKTDLAAIRYEVLLYGSTLTVRTYENEPDYSEEVAVAFDKFREKDAQSYLMKFREDVSMNHVEAKILEFVSLLVPEPFQRLNTFCAVHHEYADPTITRFDREIQFYIAYLEHIRRFRRVGLRFCYPGVSDRDKSVRSKEGFDLALAGKLLNGEQTVITNDFRLDGDERIFLVSGPNQGGKTTFARSFGQLHHLASIGLPVPGSEAKLFLFDRMFTHFERVEDIRNLRGKLQDDLVRVHATLEQATPRSILVMNEIFNSTTLQDAVFLGRKMLDRMIALDLVCVFVTFLSELSEVSPTIVSMVSTVVPENPAERTFKVVRRVADGRSYALAIAEKYRLTYADLKQRLPA